MLFTTSFSGCGFAELGVEALAQAGGKTASFGRAVEWNKDCRKILHHRHPDRCIFNDIMDLVTHFRPGKDRPSCKLARTCDCMTHNQRCDPSPKLRPGWREFQLAGPPCPPWSNFSNSAKGSSDPRYKYHQAGYKCLFAFHHQAG